MQIRSINNFTDIFIKGMFDTPHQMVLKPHIVLKYYNTMFGSYIIHSIKVIQYNIGQLLLIALTKIYNAATPA